MNKIVQFLKWFFLPRGTTKVKTFGTLPVEIQSHPILHRLNPYKFTRTCIICDNTFYSKKENPNPPVCTTWRCFKAYYNAKTEEANA